VTPEQLLEEALRQADMGIPTFPISDEKKPLCKRGFYAASIDPDRLADFFSRRRVSFIGYPTGEPTGQDVLDIDVKHPEAVAWLKAANLPPTRVCRTKSGGWHYIFRHAPGLRNSQGKICKGVDVRGTGGYAILYPEVAGSPEPAEWPPELLAQAMARPKALPLLDRKRRPGETVSTASAKDQLLRACKIIEGTPDGEKHATVVRVCYQMAAFVNGGLLDEPLAIDSIIHAAELAGAEDITKVERAWESALEKAEPVTDGSELGPLPDEEDADPGAWRAMLKTTEKGTFKGNLLNASIAFQHAPQWRGRFRYNEFSHKVELDGAPVRDGDILRAARWAQDSGIPLSGKQMAFDGMVLAAQVDAYHPVQEYLRSLAWDGTSRIDTWLIDYAGVEDTPLHRAYCTKWLIALVARVMRPGAKADNVLVLEGKQDLKKSYVFDVLCGNPEWFLDDLGDISSKSAQENIQGKWVVELAELDAISKKETSTTKAFITRRIDTFRVSYGVVAQDFPRQCLFAGTVNPGAVGYLKDETGNRRYWPVLCGVGWKPDRQIDTEGLAAVRDQILAEAFSRYQAGEAWWLDDYGLKVEQMSETAEREEEDVWFDAIRQHLKSNSLHVVRAPDLLKTPLGIELKGCHAGFTRRIGAILRKLGWQDARAYLNGKQTRAWFSPEYGTHNVVQLHPVADDDPDWARMMA
jgi:hypothetical protein